MLRTSRSIRIEVDGEVVAETTGGRLLFETQLPTRFYLPREDVRADLRPTESTSYCPYKGHASYWSLEAGGRVLEDVAWTYQEPLPDAVSIKGLVAFWDHQVDVIVDGERRDRPGRRDRKGAHRTSSGSRSPLRDGLDQLDQVGSPGGRLIGLRPILDLTDDGVACNLAEDDRPRRLLTVCDRQLGDRHLALDDHTV